jgi:hypothetical protein
MITALERSKPLVNSEDINSLKQWFKAINIVYWLQRLPMALLSIPAAYGVSAFASVHLPMPFNFLAGAAFESVYLGVVALADQMYEQDDYTTALWWLLNIVAVSMSALINVLFFSGNTFSGITAESYVHGVPLPALSFGYSLLLHQVTNKNVARDFKAEQEAKQKQAEKEAHEKEYPFSCVCSARFKTRSGLGKHKVTCDQVSK